MRIAAAALEPFASFCDCRASRSHRWMLATLLAPTAFVLAAGCGDGPGTGGSTAAVCGNGLLETGELCDTAISAGPGACPTACSDGLACTTDVLVDDGTCQASCSFPAITLPADGDGCCPVGADNNTDSDCVPGCGNGVVESGEVCDIGIATGPGACPESCTDGDACTVDVLTDGGTCQAVCSFPAIIAPVDGDGCCPAGTTSNEDSDCAPLCGNGVVDTGEVCDTAIPTGAGGCPTSCDDITACTADVLVDAGTCLATCVFGPVTVPAPGDGCCPDGANNNSDPDCEPTCGNGVLEAGELCDTAILAGPGACPESCTDGIDCTADVLTDGGTCQAVCSFPAITAPAEGDGCCPAGANNNTDSDCAPFCGNSVVEAGEACDDGNSDPDDGCDACALPILETAFRITDLDLRDPHLYVNVPFFGCRDVTDTPLFTYPSLNDTLQENIQTDGDGDGYFDLSLGLVFRPYDQTAGQTTPMDLAYADCTATADSACTAAADGATTLDATNGTGTTTCLAPGAGTTYGYVPAVTPSIAPCFSTSVTTLTLDMFGLPVVLTDARVAATYVGNPAQNMVNGLLVGFLSESSADSLLLPADLPLVGGLPFSQFLPGGDPPGTGVSCATHSDLDSNLGIPGWWFYFSFTASRVTWTHP